MSIILTLVARISRRHMHDFFTACLDCVFPPRTEELLVRTISQTQMESYYKVGTHSSILFLSDYTQTYIRALIHEAKFHRNTRAYTLLHTLIATYIQTHKDTYDLIIPIPLSDIRMRTRGHNQVVRILTPHRTQSPLPIPLCTTTLIRIKDTQPQTTLTRNERLHNMHEVFAILKPKTITRKRILLVDDVVTTGATLLAAKASLLPHKPASVTCLALAH